MVKKIFRQLISFSQTDKQNIFDKYLKIDNYFDTESTGHNFSYPSSAAAVVFGGHLSAQASFRLDRKIASNSLLHIAETVTSKPKKEDSDTMTIKFLLHKDKEEKWKSLTHIQAQSAAQTHVQQHRSPKSLHFDFVLMTE